MTVTTLTSSTISSRAISGLNQATRTIADSTQRLATGNRFARASDDAVELSISTGLRSQSVALRQAQQNNTQADNMLQVAYAGASELGEILNSMKSLAVQGNNNSLTGAESAALQTEFAGLRTQLDAIVTNTTFSGQTLLDGSLNVTTQIGEDSADTVTLTIAALDSTTLGINADDVSTPAGAVTAQGNIDTALTTVNGVLAGIGADQGSLEAMFNANSSVITELDFAADQMANTNIPEESVRYTEAVVQQQAAISVLAQTQQLSSSLLELLQS